MLFSLYEDKLHAVYPVGAAGISSSLQITCSEGRASFSGRSQVSVTPSGPPNIDSRHKPEQYVSRGDPLRGNLRILNSHGEQCE